MAEQEETRLTGYALSRNWWNYCFENPSKVTPKHTALYFYCIEHCNRLGWKENFGLPTDIAKEATNISSYNTYINTLNDLADWGFIEIIQRSRNQYRSTVIALSKNDKALYKALDEAIIKHTPKQDESTNQSNSESTIQSTSSINKLITINQETKNNTHSTRESKIFDLNYFSAIGYQFEIPDALAEALNKFLVYRNNHKLHGPIHSGEQIEAILKGFSERKITTENAITMVNNTIARGAKNIIYDYETPIKETLVNKDLSSDYTYKNSNSVL